MNKKQYLNSLPRKRIASGAIILNNKGRLLIVKPTYRDYWSLPGGVVDKNESPYHACLREALEEIGIKISIKRLVGVIYHYNKELDDEAILFHYLCSPLSNNQIKKIRLPKNEIEDFKFIKPKDISKYNQHSAKLFRKYAKLVIKDNLNNYFEDIF
jgi:8-oxo-dGTP diphosphatase